VRSSPVISACSLLTPLDRAPGKTTWQALCAGERVGTRAAVAEELLRGEKELDRSVRLALAAVERLGRTDLKKAHLFCGTSKGPVGTFLAGLENLRAGGGGGALTQMQAKHVALGVGAMAAILREQLEMDAPAHTSVAACSSGLHALHRAAAAIERGECDRALVVAADASLHPLFEGSFTRLGVLAPADAQGSRRCQPFGQAGEGFFLVEAAAAVVVENSRGEKSDVRSHNSDVAIERTWIGGDSTGLIAIDEKTRTLRAGLRAARREQELAFVHAHATGTAHDRYELAAIRAELGDHVKVFSHKKWLGHSLGAAGLVGVVISAMCHREGHTPAGATVRPAARSLTIAQGFGGHVGLVELRGT